MGSRCGLRCFLQRAITCSTSAALFVQCLRWSPSRRLAVALITFDRKSIELVLLVVGVLRDARILGWRFGPRPFS